MGAGHLAEESFPDLDERERMRDALEKYKARHGIKGVPTLHQRMRYVLDSHHLVYLSLSTLQRFVKKPESTKEEGVWAIRTFLERVTPPGAAADLANALADNLLVPVATFPPRFQPVEAYQGRYDLYMKPYTGEFFDAAFDAPHPAKYILLPAPDPRYLRAVSFNPKERRPRASFSSFLRCGPFQFLLIDTTLGEASFTLLAEVDDDPLTLQGTNLHTASAWPPHEPPYEFRLVRVQAPDYISRISRPKMTPEEYDQVKKLLSDN